MLNIALAEPIQIGKASPLAALALIVAAPFDPIAEIFVAPAPGIVEANGGIIGCYRGNNATALPTAGIFKCRRSAPASGTAH